MTLAPAIHPCNTSNGCRSTSSRLTRLCHSCRCEFAPTNPSTANSLSEWVSGGYGHLKQPRPAVLLRYSAPFHPVVFHHASRHSIHRRHTPCHAHVSFRHACHRRNILR